MVITEMSIVQTTLTMTGLMLGGTVVAYLAMMLLMAVGERMSYDLFGRLIVIILVIMLRFSI